MAKYLVLWYADQSRILSDPKERGGRLSALMNLIKQDLEKGLVKDWGAFVGEHDGYTVVEGDVVEVAKMMEQYVPFFTYKVHAIATFAQTEEVFKALTG